MSAKVPPATATKSANAAVTAKAAAGPDRRAGQERHAGAGRDPGRGAARRHRRPERPPGLERHRPARPRASAGRWSTPKSGSGGRVEGDQRQRRRPRLGVRPEPGGQRAEREADRHERQEPGRAVPRAEERDPAQPGRLRQAQRQPTSTSTKAKGGLAQSKNNTFVYQRANNKFEQVMAYYQVNQAQEYIHAARLHRGEQRVAGLLASTRSATTTRSTTRRRT